MHCRGVRQGGQRPPASTMHNINCPNKLVVGLSFVTSNSWAVFWFCSRAWSQDAAVVQQTSSKKWKCHICIHTHTHRHAHTHTFNTQIYTWERICCRNALPQSCAAGHRAPTYLLNGIQPASSQCQTLFKAATCPEYFKISHEYFFRLNICQFFHSWTFLSPSHHPFSNMNWLQRFAQDTTVGYVLI